MSDLTTAASCWRGANSSSLQTGLHTFWPGATSQGVPGDAEGGAMIKTGGETSAQTVDT